MRPLVIISVLTLLAFGACGQVATVAAPGELDYTATTRGGEHAGLSLAGTVDDVGLGIFARSLGSTWDVGTEYRFFRSLETSGGSGTIFDLGATAIYGSRGGKLAGEAGLVFGNASDTMGWIKGIAGNFQAVSAGVQIRRVTLSGAYGNYFENRGDLGVKLDRAGHYIVTGGWSSALGWNGGVTITFARKK